MINKVTIRKNLILPSQGYVLLASNLENSVTHYLSQVLFKPSWSILSPPEDELLSEQGSVIAMANRLQWKYVVVVLDNDFVMERLNEALAREDICVVANIFINTNKYEFCLLLRILNFPRIHSV